MLHRLRKIGLALAAITVVALPPTIHTARRESSGVGESGATPMISRPVGTTFARNNPPRPVNTWDYVPTINPDTGLIGPPSNDSGFTPGPGDTTRVAERLPLLTPAPTGPRPFDGFLLLPRLADGQDNGGDNTDATNNQAGASSRLALLQSEPGTGSGGSGIPATGLLGGSINGGNGGNGGNGETPNPPTPPTPGEDNPDTPFTPNDPGGQIINPQGPPSYDPPFSPFSLGNGLDIIPIEPVPEPSALPFLAAIIIGGAPLLRRRR